MVYLKLEPNLAELAILSKMNRGEIGFVFLKKQGVS